MQTASKYDITSQSKSNFRLQPLPDIAVHEWFTKDLSESLLYVHDLTSRGCEILFTDTVFIPEFTSTGTAVSDNRHDGFSLLGNDLPQGRDSSNSVIRYQVNFFTQHLGFLN